MSAIFSPTSEVDTSCGKLTVRKLLVDDIPHIAACFDVFLPALDGFTAEAADAVDGTKLASVLLTGLSNPDTSKRIKSLVESLVDAKKGSLDRLSIADLLAVVNEFFVVNDLEELKSLFFALKGRMTTGTGKAK